MGESVVAVDVLLKKHSDFEKTLIAQSDKIDALKKDADSLASCDADYRDEIEKMYIYTIEANSSSYLQKISKIFRKNYIGF